MQHIYQDNDGLVHIDPYFAYLAAIQDKLPPNARRFALKREHYTLAGQETLHDAWLES